MKHALRLWSVLLLALCAFVTVRGNQAADSAWPPGVQRVPEDAPALSAEEEAKTFFLPPGYRVELVAQDPMVVDPVVIDWDLEGRLWVVEMPGYMHDLLAASEGDATGRVVVLEDTDGDGVMDKRTTFLEGLVRPRALKVLDDGVLVAEPPRLWLARDTNGDLRADTKVLVTDTYGTADGNIETNLNSLLWAFDNWLHTSGGDMDLRLKDGAFEIRPMRIPGQWGASQDDGGRIYRNNNESVLHVGLVDQSYFARHPHLVRTRGSHESLAEADDALNAVWPVRPTPGVNRGYQTGVLRSDRSLSRYTAAGAPTVYRGDRLPKDLYGNVFVIEPAANVVSRIITWDDGNGMRARKAYDSAEFMASTDERFRPVYLSNAPDGTLYVVDMYKPIIQHKMYITEYLLEHIRSRQLDAPASMGRIWRIVHESTARQTHVEATESTAKLVGLLSHPNGWWRETGQRLLVERGDVSAVPALEKLLADDTDPRARLHALWTLDGLGALDADTVVEAMGDSSRDVRTAAIRLSERWLAAGDARVSAAVLARMDESDWAVRHQLAASLPALPGETGERAVAAFLDTHGDDPVAVDVALSGLQTRELAVIERLLALPELTPSREAAITMLTATIVRGGQDGPAQTVLTWMSGERGAEWQRTAMLHGAEVALLGVRAPGDRPPVRRAMDVAAPCPTCPGGRGGPGGTRAFGELPVAPPAPARRLRLEREPVLARSTGDETTAWHKRVAAVLARVDWPGKTGAAPDAPALTDAEQRRFAEGETVYRSLCQACHQADGQGQANIGAPLIGAAMVVGRPDWPIRILLGGKDGTVGLMPPLGSALTDDQIANVLTYVRRSWGHTASPIDPETVATVRASSGSRTRPWTEDELRAADPPVIGPLR